MLYASIYKARKATGESFFVQDDSASQLQDDSGDFANEAVIADYMAALT